MDGLGNYGSDEDSDHENDSVQEFHNQLSSSSLQNQFKLPSVSELLTSTPQTTMTTNWKNDQIPSFKRKVEEDGRVFEDNSKDKQQKVLKNNLFRPPQLNRPNVITEDYNAWSASSRGSNLKDKSNT
jgi:hypothetical protein